MDNSNDKKEVEYTLKGEDDNCFDSIKSNFHIFRVFVAIAVVAFFVILIILYTNEEIYGPYLWKTTRCGMSVNSIKKIYPEAVVPDFPESLSGGAKELLRIPHYEINNEDFSIEFYFKNKKLKSVYLVHNKELRIEELERSFQKFLLILSSHYGDDYQYNVSGNIFGKNEDATWKIDDTTLCLGYFYVTNNPEKLKFFYKCN